MFGKNKNIWSPNCIERDFQERFCTEDFNSSQLSLDEYFDSFMSPFQEIDGCELDDSASLLPTFRMDAALYTCSNKNTSSSAPHHSAWESHQNTTSYNEDSLNAFQQSRSPKKSPTLLPHTCIDDSNQLYLNQNNGSRSLSHLEIDDYQLPKEIHRGSMHSKYIDLPWLQKINDNGSSLEFNYDQANTGCNIQLCEDSENCEENKNVSMNKRGTEMFISSSKRNQKDYHDIDVIPFAESDAETSDASCIHNVGYQSVNCDLDVDNTLTDELNINNHKICCLPKKKKINQDLLNVTEENFCLSNQNCLLRQTIRNVRKSTDEECSKILDKIISYCECKANHKQGTRKRRAVSTCDNERVGAGCSTGSCGGYTPSGWNKLMTLHCLQCDAPACPCCYSSPCPPCSPCPDPCEGIIKRIRRKPQSCTSMKYPQLTDENASATNVRPSTRILGELAFQLERRILDNVFGMEGHKRRRFYGYTVNNIYQMMHKECKNLDGEEDPILRKKLEVKFRKLMRGLKQVGYNAKVHGDFAQQMINRYGLLAYPPDEETIKEFGLQNCHCISKLIVQLARGEHEASNFQTLLRSLYYISRYDGWPLFVW